MKILNCTDSKQSIVMDHVTCVKMCKTAKALIFDMDNGKDIMIKIGSGISNPEDITKAIENAYYKITCFMRSKYVSAAFDEIYGSVLIDTFNPENGDLMYDGKRRGF